MTERTTAGELNEMDLGRTVLGVPEILGWEAHLLLCDVRHDTDAETTHLGFRWNDSPDKSNTKRGQFAVGVRVPFATVVTVTSPSPTPNADESGARA